MSKTAYLRFKSLEEQNLIMDIADESDYKIIHHMIDDTEIMGYDFDGNTLEVKLTLDTDIDEGELDTISSELDYAFTNTDNDEDYNMELIEIYF